MYAYSSLFFLHTAIAYRIGGECLNSDGQWPSNGKLPGPYGFTVFSLSILLSLYLPGHLDEAVVERQRMAYRVLPALLIVLVVGEVGHDPLVDFRKSKHLILAFLNGQSDQTDVAIWRLRISITTLAPDL